MIELSTIRDLVAIFGVIAGFSYYVLTVRNNQKTQKQQIETRQFQLLMQISQYSMSKEGSKDVLEWLNMEWEDYGDFERKYGSENNPENYALRTSMSNWYNNLGILVKNKMIDPELVYEYVGYGVIWGWKKFEDIILVRRELYNVPEAAQSWEYLYNEMMRIHKRKGYSTEYSKTPTKFSSEIKEKLDEIKRSQTTR